MDTFFGLVLFSLLVLWILHRAERRAANQRQREFEQEQIRQWARDHWKPNSPVKWCWGSTVRDEWQKLNALYIAKQERARRLELLRNGIDPDAELRAARWRAGDGRAYEALCSACEIYNIDPNTIASFREHKQKNGTKTAFLARLDRIREAEASTPRKRGETQWEYNLRVGIDDNKELPPLPTLP